MSRYITEIANDIAKCCPDLVENGCGNDNCVACLAFKLIGLGYQKQSDTADVVEVVRCRDCKHRNKERGKRKEERGMRNRLIDLILECRTYTPEYSKQARLHAEYLAQHLLNEGVIVPPCKVGATLYFLYDRPHADKPDLTPRIYETNEWYFDVDEKGVSIKPRWVHGYKGEYHYYLGKTVFLTKEEAEKALAERSENGK